MDQTSARRVEPAIPAPRSWNNIQAHAAQDDLAEWAHDNLPRVGRLDREDIEAATQAQRVHIASIVMPTEAASAVSGIGFENEPAPAPRRLPYLIRPPSSRTVVLLVMLAAGCLARFLWGAS